ncbi:MAG TPA: OsmC family protein [Candidatus Limnocylindria bacterium]|jgi:organic hydroperoxide reductase OsmC/OhrA|nr:OsmC family protein [Candidatus Limnocylindria bacterium]
MSGYIATIRWDVGQGQFLAGKYSREHTWTFDGGVTVPASSSPHVVPVPWSNPAGVDPEEAFVAAIASCHMLTLLYLASRRGFQIDRYEDSAVGTMEKNSRGVPWVSRVVLHPVISYGGAKRPTSDEEAQLHHDSHEQCYIANSVKTDIVVDGFPAH